MNDFSYTCGADIRSIKNKVFARYETTKANEIVIALDKSGVPFFAKCSGNEISLTYDGSYKESVDEILAKVMSGNYEELLREIKDKKNPDGALILLSEIADVLNTTVGTLKARPAEVQELLCKTYVDFWLCDTATIQRELDRIITVNGRTLSDIQEHEKSKEQEKNSEKSTAENAPTFTELFDDYFRRNSHKGFTKEAHKQLSEIARRRQNADYEKAVQTDEFERKYQP